MKKNSTLRQPGAPSLKREIAVLLLLKLILLYAIWALWFDSPMPKTERAAKTARIILNR